MRCATRHMNAALRRVRTDEHRDAIPRFRPLLGDILRRQEHNAEVVMEDLTAHEHSRCDQKLSTEELFAATDTLQVHSDINFNATFEWIRHDARQKKDLHRTLLL